MLSITRSAQTLAALALALALASLPGRGQAQEIAGVWELSTSTAQGSTTSTLTLAVEDGELSGSLEMSMRGRAGAAAGRRAGGAGGAGGAGRRAMPQQTTLALTEIEVEGESFSFVANLSMGGRSIAMTYSGTFSGDEMEGTVQGPRGEPRSFTGKRRED